MPAPVAREIVESFRQQAAVCGAMGSPMYQTLLARAADDLVAGGPFAALVEGWQGHPVLDVLPLRALGAIHALVLADEAPALAAHYPSVGGRFDAEAAWPAVRGLVEERLDELRPRLRDQVQTNEVRRCCALLGGILRFAAATGRPLRLREIGASAGLNLLFDRYRYRLGDRAWGTPASRLRLDCEWRGAAPALGHAPVVWDRAGCDVDPIDVRDPAQRVRLASYAWPDQLERLARLRAAIAIACEDPPPLFRARAGDWLADALAAPARGAATLLFQSVMWWYVPRDEQARVIEVVEAAGARATADAPLGWLRMEGASTASCEVRLRTWPGGEDVPLAHTHYHGEWVEWLA